jgi:hypothetical protein
MGDFVVQSGGDDADSFLFAATAKGAAGIILVEQNQAGCWELSTATATRLAVALLLAAGVDHTIGPR